MAFPFQFQPANQQQNSGSAWNVPPPVQGAAPYQPPTYGYQQQAAAPSFAQPVYQPVSQPVYQPVNQPAASSGVWYIDGVPRQAQPGNTNIPYPNMYQQIIPPEPPAVKRPKAQPHPWEVTNAASANTVMPSHAIDPFWGQKRPGPQHW
ncbi:hypothetical protein F4818DRAFT_445219 [Hypoxylon cercidicola]|nr:hypothetical protein F4818DRAFT_445219 [Hypoxylon cercidicola]